MKITISNEFEVFNHCKGYDLPQEIQEAVSQFNIYDILNLFCMQHPVGKGGFIFSANGATESGDGILVKVYRDDDELFDWVSGENDQEPDYMVIGIIP